MKPFLWPLGVFVLCLLPTVCSGYVYSVVLKWEKLDGYEDCFKVDYALWETNNSTQPEDDIHKGNYSVVVGTDCTTGGTGGGNYSIPAWERGSDIMPTPSSVVGQSLFRCYPNPANETIQLEVPEDVNPEHEMYWSLISPGQKVLQSGKIQARSLSDWSLDVSLLPPGTYYLVLFGPEDTHHTASFVISQ